jgi:hypothetical protein
MGRSARTEEFHASEVGMVHVLQRCVRRAWLRGVDDKTGQDYLHRREWLMRLIFRNRPDGVAKWTDQEVAVRSLRVLPG